MTPRDLEHALTISTLCWLAPLVLLAAWWRWC